MHGCQGFQHISRCDLSPVIGPEGVVPTGCSPRKRGCAFPAAGVRVSHRSGLFWDIYQFEVEATIIRDLHWVSVQVDNNINIYPFGILLVRSFGPCLCGYSALVAEPRAPQEPCGPAARSFSVKSAWRARFRDFFFCASWKGVDPREFRHSFVWPCPKNLARGQHPDRGQLPDRHHTFHGTWSQVLSRARQNSPSTRNDWNFLQAFGLLSFWINLHREQHCNARVQLSKR